MLLRRFLLEGLEGFEGFEGFDGFEGVEGKTPTDTAVASCSAF